MSLVCPKCKASKFSPELQEKGIYLCINKTEDDNYCREIVGARCKTCDMDRPFSDFGKHGDVYECKECGKVNWPLTEYLRETEEEIARIKASIERANKWGEELNRWAKKY